VLHFRVQGHENGPARWLPPGPGPRRGNFMATEKSSAPHAHPSTEDQDHPHACNDGWVTIGQISLDPETGEEVEEFALYLCRRCAAGEDH
jgi:hypothetical protein